MHNDEEEPEKKRPTAASYESVITFGAFVIALFGLNPHVDLFTVHGYFLGRIDPNSDLVAFHSQDSHRHIVTNHQGFTHATSQTQQLVAPWF